MIQEYQLRLLPEQAASNDSIKQYISWEKGLDVRTIKAIRILKRSIDARQRTIFVNLKVRVFINELPEEEAFTFTEYRDVSDKPAVIVVGAGPGGLFASLKLIELGLRPIVVERGKNVRERKEDLARISREHKVDAESNYSFGEGGAGAYSDGKLYTRSKKRGNVEKILNVFCQHGADTSILIDAHPHIGTDKLPRVIENMRNTILACGGEVHFQTRMDALIIEHGQVTGIDTNTGKTFCGPVILATGHSARDVYRWLYANGVYIEPKGIAVGVRLEHPSMLIDQIQYHNKAGRGKYLPAAEYSFVQQVDGRGVYSFCMCPGGFVVPAASGPHQIVVNGMSPSNRGTKWSNSGMVVELRTEDLAHPDLQLQACASKDRGRKRSSVSDDAIPREIRTNLLATREYAPNGSCATDGGLHPQEAELRPASLLIQSRTNLLSAPFLDAEVHRRPPEPRFSGVRQKFTRLPYQRCCNDSCRDPHFSSRPHHPQCRNTPTRRSERTLPLRRRSRICRRNRLGRHRRRAVCRSGRGILQTHHLISPQITQIKIIYNDKHTFFVINF